MIETFLESKHYGTQYIFNKLNFRIHIFNCFLLKNIVNYIQLNIHYNLFRELIKEKGRILQQEMLKKHIMNPYF